MDRRRINRRGVVRITAFGLAAFLALGGFAFQLWQERERLERYVEADYQHSFSELVEGLSAIEHALQKELYAVSPQLVSQLSNEVARVSASAGSMMAALPFSFEELEDTAQFLSRVGDWSASVGRSAAAGNGITAEQRETLEHLSGKASYLAAKLVELQTIINEENLQIGSVLRSEETLESDTPGLFGGAFKEFAAELSGMPSLVYDGPFSSHLEQKVYKMLEAEEEVSVETALENAAGFLSMDSEQLSFAYESAGDVPSYIFTGYADGGEVDIQITRQGGRVLSMVNTAPPEGEATLSLPETIKLADEFLQSKGFVQMEHNYHQIMGSYVLINYHYVDNGIACYPDLVKVGVSLETGKITRFESKAYLQNHTPSRQWQPAVISGEEAQKSALIGDLTLENHREVLIPVTGGELHCHELVFQTADGTHVLIYVNAQTGTEEKIMILIESEDGTLAI